MRELTEQEEKDIQEAFVYHAPEGQAQLDAYAEVRVAGKELARTILRSVAPSADRSAAVRKVREAVMTANAAIALAPQDYAPGGACNP